jgi:predicted nucleic acid-binding protein
VSDIWVVNASPVIGTLGIVLRAKRKALIPSAADVLRSLRTAGFRLDDELVQSALKGIGEPWERGA